MKLLIFKTDITSNSNLNKAKSIFTDQLNILDWNIDTEDIDNVLRIEAKDTMQEHEVISLVRNYGFRCEVLEG